MRLKLLTAAIVASWGVSAAQPKSVEELWQILERQQRQIEALQRKLERLEAKKPTELEKRIEKRVEEKLGERTSILARELEKLRTMLLIPEEKKYKSVWGLGPAASKVYQLERGLSLGGYGEGHYRVLVDDQGGGKDRADFVRLVLYAGYRFTDRLLFNIEIEFEHGTTGEGAEEKGSVSVEFAYLDFLFDRRLNARAGMVLIPVGFINLIHEPPFYFGNNRPLVETVIIPTTWGEIGAGIFGEVLPGLSYSLYGVNSLKGEAFSAKKGIREARQSGSKALAESLAFTGRIDYRPPFFRSLTLGASAFIGDTGQDQRFGNRKLDLFTQIYEGHLQLNYRGLHLKGLGAVARIDGAGALSRIKGGDPIGNLMFGWYTEVAYDLMPWFNRLLGWEALETQSFEPFFRYERWDTQAELSGGFRESGRFDRRIWQVGLHYRPHPNVVLKADYRNWDSDSGDLPDDFNLGIGFIF